jgi:hypothetical protein
VELLLGVVVFSRVPDQEAIVGARIIHCLYLGYDIPLPVAAA